MPADDLYTEIVTEYSRDTRNRRHVHHPTATQQGVNPSCGDEIELELRCANGIVEDIAFTGEGCAISMASVAMMADLVRGKTVEEANRLLHLFLHMITEGKTEGIDALEDAVALQGVAKMPARVKCAVLPWRTMEKALDEHG